MERKLCSKARYFVALVSLSLLASSCRQGPVKEEGKLLVVTTTGLIADAVKNVGDSGVQVVALMGPGVDPHLYKASHGDVRYIAAADIVFYNGLHLEGKMGSVLEKTSTSRTVVAVTRGIPAGMLIPLSDDGNTFDPHVWFDIRLWKYVVEEVRNVLQEADPSRAGVFARNAQRYLEKLDSLDETVRARLATIPPEQRVLITAHDAFGYFGRAYDIEVRGLQGISTLSEFGLRDVTGLVDFIVERNIRAIFAETSVSDKSIRAIIQGCERRNWPVKMGGSLYSDALGDSTSGAHTYTGMVSSNMTMIFNSLR